MSKMKTNAILSVVLDRHTGKYIKSGGSWKQTNNLQEAQIFGWSRNAKESLKRYDTDQYEIIPVTIEV